MAERWPARRRGRANDAPAPFWTRMCAIALYPLRGGALFTLLALALFSLLGALPGVGTAFTVLTALATYAYGFDILRHSADGYPDPPERRQNLVDGGVLRLFVLLLLATALVLTVLAVTDDRVAMLIVALALTLLAPASLASLAIDDSLRRAVNPAVLLGVVRRIGWPYLAAFAVLALTEACAMKATDWLHDHLPPLLDQLTMFLVSGWGMFATCHLIGYLIYQYHDALGFQPASRIEAESDDPDQPLLDEAEEQVRDGRPDLARALLRDAMRTRTTAISPSAHALYHRLLLQETAPEALDEHARRYLTRLIDDRQPRQALTLMRTMLDRQPDFVPAQVSQATLLLEYATMTGQYRLACDMLLALLQHWPRSPQQPRWSLQAGLLLAERLGREDQARPLLQQALAASADPELRRRARAALAALPATAADPPSSS